MGGRFRTAIILTVAMLVTAGAAAAVAQASVVVLGGTYVATPGEVNQITIDKHADDFSYTDAGASSIDASSTSCTVAGDQVTCPWYSAGLSFEVYSGDQDDTITDTQGGAPYFELQGGSGDDRITASSFIGATGGPGNDHIVGGPADDHFFGGPGRFDPKGAAALPDNDTIEGFGAGDVVHGDLGDDLIDGGEGGDSLEGDEGNDVVRGGPGNDFIDGPSMCCAPLTAGSDVLDGGEGDDMMSGARDGGAPDTLSCGPGNDFAEIGPGDQVGSDCEEIEQYVSCPGSGGCSVALDVSAFSPPPPGSAAAASKRQGRRVVLGSRKTRLGAGSKPISIRLNRGRLAKVLRGDGKAKALLEVKVLKKKSKPKRISRTPFGLSR
jgi:Ca2+-binding RTX toxin-like protein